MGIVFTNGKSYKPTGDHRIRFTWANGSGAAFGAGLATSGVPNTFQNLSVSSPAAEATVHPSGLCSYLITK